jgi:hypothetical protein
MAQRSGGDCVRRVKGDGELTGEAAPGVLEFYADGVEWSVAEVFCMMERLRLEEDDARLVVLRRDVHDWRLAFHGEASGRKAVGDHYSGKGVGVNFFRSVRRGGDFEYADIIGFEEDFVVRGGGDDSVCGVEGDGLAGLRLSESAGEKKDG